MKRKKIMAGLFGAVTMVAALSVAFWPTQVDAGGGSCELAGTQFASSGAPEPNCPWARRECEDELDSRLGSICIGPGYTGEVCGLGSVSFGNCTGPKHQKVIDCQRQVYCETADLPF